MAIISITITESENQSISGIPNFVVLTTNVPASIFYTFDGSDPDTSSLIYTGGELALPLNQPSVRFKLFATNGTDTCPIIEKFFRSNIIKGRQSHDRVNIQQTKKKATFPYGTESSSVPTNWGQVGPSDLIVDKPDVPNKFDGYDGTATGTVTGGTDLDLSEYLILFSDSNRANTERGRGIGNLPSQVTVQQPAAPPAFSDRNDQLFNPRALVIFQDSRRPPADPNIVNINRQFFDLQNPEKVKDGILLNTTGIEGNVPTGSLVRTHFNPRENTLTYYYHDSQALRWIISKESFTPKSPRTHGLQKIMFSPRGEGARKVFQWIPFKGSRLI